MDILLNLVIVWAVVTAVDGIVVLYRMKLTSHEVTGIRIEDTEAGLPAVQEEFAKTIEKFNSYVKWLTTTSAAILVAIAGLWIYQLFTKGY